MTKKENPIRIDDGGEIIISDPALGEAVAEALLALVENPDDISTRGNRGCTVNTNCAAGCKPN